MEKVVLSLDMKGIRFEDILCSMNFIICKMKLNSLGLRFSKVKF